MVVQLTRSIRNDGCNVQQNNPKQRKHLNAVNGIILVNYVVRCVGRRRNRKLVQKGKLEDVRMSFTELIFVASLPVLRRAAVKRDYVQSDCVIAFVLLQLHEVHVVTVFAGDRQGVCAVTHFELRRLVTTQLYVTEVDIVDPRDSASVFVSL